MDKPSYKLVGAPCGQHGQYTFYKALRLSGSIERIIAIGDFFFVRIWQDSELVSVGELQLLWTDRVSDQTLVSLRLYFLPENTPDGRCLHGQDEVLAINEKVVLRADDLLSWVCNGGGWRWGLRAVWKGACAPPADSKLTTPLHHTKLDFSDVDRERSAMTVDTDSPGVVVFSYPRYCRYRALLARLEGIQADWLRDSLVAALGGYAAPTNNTRILYCKDTFEYPELEGHEFVCNHLAPKLKGRPRGRRRARARSRDRDHDPDRDRDSRSSDSDATSPPEPRTPRRVSLRNGADKQSDEEEDTENREEERDNKRQEENARDEAFLQQLREFYMEDVKIAHTKNISLRKLYSRVRSCGGYEAACRGRVWKLMYGALAPRARRLYERFLLLFENHQRRENPKLFPKMNGRLDEPKTIDTIDVTDSPLRDIDNKPELPEKRLRTPSPKKEKEKEKLILDNETGELMKEDMNVTSKPAEELNREFLESLSQQKTEIEREKESERDRVKISVKPVEKLIEPAIKDEKGTSFLNELAQKLHLGNTDTTILKELSDAQSSVASTPLSSLSSLSDKYAVNGHTAAVGIDQQKSRPVGRSSLRAVRVKPTMRHPRPNTPSQQSAVTETSPPPSAPLTNFGIHHPPHPPPPSHSHTAPQKTHAAHSDDEIVEVPYKPKTPEIIDLDEYPESPQGIKKKKLEILKERGLEVTAVPPAPIWPQGLATPITPLLNPAPIILNPALQHQIMTQPQLFQMYSIIPPNFANGVIPPKVIQATSAFGSSGPEKTVYGNPKDPFMPPPHVLQGTPIKPQRSIQVAGPTPQAILDLTCKTQSPPPQIPAVEIVRVPPQSPKTPTPQNLSKNYTLVDGKAVVGSNLEITLVNPKTPTPQKRPPQKRSSNGKFTSAKTPTPPKDYPKPYPPPSPSGVKKPPIIVPNYQISRDDVSPTSSTGSKESQSSSQNNLLANVFKGQNLTQMMDMQKNIPVTPFMDPMYMNAFYSSLGQMDQHQLALYRDFMANQFRGYTGLLNIGTPTTKN